MISVCFPLYLARLAADQGGNFHLGPVKLADVPDGWTGVQTFTKRTILVSLSSTLQLGPSENGYLAMGDLIITERPILGVYHLTILAVYSFVQYAFCPASCTHNKRAHYQSCSIW